MEHKLILGGWQHLPFARSRIRAMKATGQKYVSEVFKIEGATIRVRLVGDQEYIHIDGGTCDLRMDAGVIDVLGVAPLDSARYTSAIRYKAGSVEAYEAHFTEPSSKGGHTNPNTGDAGQIAGIVSGGGGKFRGRIPPGAPSFQAGSAEDDLLWAKKLATTSCPASVFTGRCRLYVQAMYGLPLHEFDGDGNIESTNEPMAVDAGVPALHVPAYRAPGDEVSYTPVPLNTSCGVYLDRATGEHWLIRPTLTEINIYPLISSKCGEKARPYIRDSGRLNEVDKAHLEAFILAYCKPDVANMQTSATDLSEPGLYSMGYGWHWNWDGTQANMVKNETISTTGVNAKMRSTHWTMIVTRTAAALTQEGGPLYDWNIPVFALDGGPKDWGVDRSIWVITEPSHANGTQVKATPRYCDIIECTDVPFYVYYNGNNLKKCVVSVTSIPGGTERNESFGCNSASGYMFSRGLMDGWFDVGTFATHYKAQFRCAETDSLPLRRARAKTGSYGEVLNKVQTGPVQVTEGSIGYFAYTAPDAYTYPINDPLATYEFESRSWINGFAKAGLHHPMTWTVEIGTFSETEVGGAIIVVPMYDAEAVFMESVKTVTGHKDGTKEGMSGLMTWDYGYRLYADNDAFYTGPVLYDRVYYQWASTNLVGPTLADTTEVIDQDTGEEERETYLLCRGTEIDATFTSQGDFYNQELEEVEDPYPVLSNAAQGQTDVVIAYGHILAVGMHEAEPAIPVMVGWL